MSKSRTAALKLLPPIKEEEAADQPSPSKPDDKRPILETVLPFEEADPEGELLAATLEYQTLTKQESEITGRKEKLKKLIKLYMGPDWFPELPILRDKLTGTELKWYPKVTEEIQDHILLQLGVSPDIIAKATKTTETRYFRVFMPKPKKDSCLPTRAKRTKR